MTNLVGIILEELFDEEHNLNYEKALDFVSGEYDITDDEEKKALEDAVFASLTTLNIPEEFIISNFKRFNKFSLIMEGHFNDKIALSNLEDFAEIIVKNASGDSAGGVLEQCLDVMINSNSISTLTESYLALEALKMVRNTHERALKEFGNTERIDEIVENINKVYDTIFLTFSPVIAASLEAHYDGFEYKYLFECLLPWTFVMFESLISLEIPESIKEQLTEDDYLRAIGYLDDMMMIKNAVRSYENSGL